MTVDNYNIRIEFELFECVEDCRDFSESEESGDIRESDGPADQSCINRFESGKSKYDCSCPAHGSIIFKTNVNPRNSANRGEIVDLYNALSKSALLIRRLPWCQFPIQISGNSHSLIIHPSLTFLANHVI